MRQFAFFLQTNALFCFKAKLHMMHWQQRKLGTMAILYFLSPTHQRTLLEAESCCTFQHCRLSLIGRSKGTGAYLWCSRCQDRGILVDGTVRYGGYCRWLSDEHPLRPDGVFDFRDPPLHRTNGVSVEEADLVESARERGVDLSTFFGCVCSRGESHFVICIFVGVNGRSFVSNLPYNFDVVWQLASDAMHMVSVIMKHFGGIINPRKGKSGQRSAGKTGGQLPFVAFLELVYLTHM